LIFLRMLENLIMGHLEKQIEVRCFKNAMNSFLVNNFCSYCSNVEQNPS